jgi:hypothetical protein
VDAIEPILPHPALLPSVGAAHRSEPIHRDGHRGGGAEGESRHGRGEEEAVEVAVEGVDLTAGDEPDPPAHQIDLTA